MSANALGDRDVVIGGGVVAHWLGQGALVLQREVAPLFELGAVETAVLVIHLEYRPAADQRFVAAQQHLSDAADRSPAHRRSVG